jgi:peptidoglycan/LPS O-acetylase OafA/YrhL
MHPITLLWKNLKMSEVPVREESKVACLEGLRGVLAMWVVIGHVLQYSGRTVIPVPLIGLVTRGDYAVKLFMLLSGFVIAHLTTRKPEGYGGYLKRRFLRIYPMLFVGVIMALALHQMRGDLLRDFWVSYMPVDSLEQFRQIWEGHDKRTATYLAMALTMTNGIVPNWLVTKAEYPFNGVTWSLSLEFQFYLVAPFLSRFFLERGRWLWGCVFVFVVIVLRRKLFPDVGGQPWSFGGFLPFNIEWFVLGMLSYLVYGAVGAGVQGEKSGRSGLLDLSAGILLLTAVGDAWRLTGVNGFEQVFGDRLPLMVWVVVMSYMIDVKQGRSGILNRGMAWLLESRVSLWLGRISYSMYLIHVPMIILVQWLVVRHLGVTTWRWCFAATAVLAIPVTLVVAAGCYRWVELPFINLGKRKVKDA